MTNTVGEAIVRTHSKFAPSKAHRWLVCPGSVRVTEDLESEWAALGTKKHAALAWMFGYQKDQERAMLGPLIAGDIIESEAGDYEVTREVLDQCQDVIDYVAMYRATHPDWSVETETRVEVGSRVWPRSFAPGECDGTADVAAYCWDELLVLDAKFGWVKVYPRNNPQLYLYALGMLEAVNFYPIEWVTVCIAQPDYSGDMQFREHRMHRRDLEQWAIDQVAAIERAVAEDPTLVPDDKACQWCPARAYCSARLQWAEESMVDGFMNLYTTEELLPYVPRLRAIARDIEQRAMSELNAGRAVQGYKLVESNSRRKWPEGENDILVAERVCEAAGLPPVMRPLLFETTLKSPAEVEKLVYATYEKRRTKKEVKAMVDKVAFKPTGAPKLAPASDERPAVEAASWTAADILEAQLEASVDDS